jgi:hypothetical protein
MGDTPVQALCAEPSSSWLAKQAVRKRYPAVLEWKDFLLRHISRPTVMAGLVPATRSSAVKRRWPGQARP